MTSTPAYISERIKRPVPTGCSVIPGSTPVISFGNAETAKIATLGLNPSRQEFATADGTWLVDANRRLATYEQLGISNLENATEELVTFIVNDCYNYFHLNPYMRWFKDLESLLIHGTDTSYFEGTACHLDLVQWATEPVWQRLSEDVKAKLIEDDRDFLMEQLKNEGIKLVLLNGRSVINQVQNMGVQLFKKAPETLGKLKSDILTGVHANATYIGWSTNLQSSFGITNEFKLALAQRVKLELTRNNVNLMDS